MKVSSTVGLRTDKSAVDIVQQSVDTMLQAAFDKATAMERVPVLDNSLFVYMGFLKVTMI